jgi:hypothetical protein
VRVFVVEDDEEMAEAIATGSAVPGWRSTFATFQRLGTDRTGHGQGVGLGFSIVTPIDRQGGRNPT